MAERLKASVLKTEEGKPSVGSNPTPSASKNKQDKETKMGLFKKGKIWYYNFILKKKRHSGSCHTEKKSEAKDYEDKVRSIVRSCLNEEYLLDSVRRCYGVAEKNEIDYESILKKYLKGFSECPTGRRLYREKFYVNVFCDYFLKNDVKYLEDINEKNANDFYSYIKEFKKSGYWKSRLLATSKKIMSIVCKKQGNENPFSKYVIKQTVETPKEILTKKEIESLLKKSTGYLHYIIFTGINTGLRLGDIAHLRWDDINLDDMYIKVKTNKNHTTATIPITESFLEYLINIKKTGDFVCEDAALTYDHANWKISRDFNILCDKCGIENQVTLDGGRKQAKKGIHSLRHTFIYNGIKNNVSLNTMSKITGHKCKNVTMTYADHCSLSDVLGERDKISIM